PLSRPSLKHAAPAPQLPARPRCSCPIGELFCRVPGVCARRGRCALASKSPHQGERVPLLHRAGDPQRSRDRERTMNRPFTDDDWRRIKYAGRILGGVTGTAAGVAGLSAALLMRQAADARRIIPVAEAPPPRGDGLYGAKFPGTPLSMVILGDSTGAGYGVHRPRETPGALLATGVSGRFHRAARARPGGAGG